MVLTVRGVGRALRSHICDIATDACPVGPHCLGHNVVFNVIPHSSGSLSLLPRRVLCVCSQLSTAITRNRDTLRYP